MLRLFCDTKYFVNFFDLVFLVLFVTTAVSLVVSGVHAVRGRNAQAMGVLRRIGIGTAIYFGILIVASLVSARREYKLGDRQCFDDWCVTVDRFSRKPADQRMEYSVTLRVSSRARRISQRERNLAAYMTAARGWWFEAAAGGPPTDVLLGPLQSVEVPRLFSVPADATDLGLVVTHEGGFPIEWLIIGYDAWFRKAPVVRLG